MAKNNQSPNPDADIRRGALICKRTTQALVQLREEKHGLQRELLSVYSAFEDIIGPFGK